MQRILTACMCAAVLALPGCKGCKEQRARYGPALKAGPAPRVQAATPSAGKFRGLDLTTAARTTRAGDLPDLWEERPRGSGSFEIRKDVRCVYHGLDGAVYHVPEKDCFYIQHDPPGSSTMTFYGPFPGSPEKVLKLGAVNGAEPAAPADADKPGPGRP